ncbi:SLAM family member 7 isoform X2 [Nannospalax galili]|uniref:SLAM family member 7 isoform X2 n=1 Tax=Nannospalax galili TaxID=1026970 RepID=UPI0004ED068D|nr:SLAM family member 7 isoform X2 [Nannospalax galili]
MAGFPTSIILTSLLCQITVTVAFGTLKELAGAIDGSVTFTLNITVKQVDSIVWTFKTLSLVTIQPSKNRKQDNVIVAQNRNKERIAFSEGDYSLKLSQLKKNDSGVYRVEIYSTSSQSPFTQEYVLHVYEYLSKPKVTRGLQNNKNGTCITNLTCSIEQGGENVTYSWRVMGQAANESHDGSFLPISWRLGETDMTFICTARNPISNSSSSPILSWELCEGAANDPKFSVVFTVVLLTVLFTVIVLLLTVAFIVRTEKRKEKESSGRCSKHTLFHCADTQSGEESQQPACNARHIKVIKLRECPLDSYIPPSLTPKKLEDFTVLGRNANFCYT